MAGDMDAERGYPLDLLWSSLFLLKHGRDLLGTMLGNERARQTDGIVHLPLSIPVCHSMLHAPTPCVQGYLYCVRDLHPSCHIVHFMPSNGI